MKLLRCKPLGRRILALALSSAVLLSTAACGTGTGDGSSGTSSGSSSAKGRYVEEELSMPQPDSNPISLAEQNGSLKLIAHEGIYESADGGKTWQETNSGSKTLDGLLKKGQGLSNACWGPEGKLAFTERGENETYRYWIADQNGAEKELLLDLPPNEAFSGMLFSGGEDSEDEPEAETGKSATVDAGDEGGETDFAPPANNIQQFQFLSDGTLLGLDQNGTIYQIDPESGAFLQTLKPGKNNMYTDFAVTKDTLVARHYNGVDLYSLSGWTLRETDSVLNEFFNGSGDLSASADGSFTTITRDGVPMGLGDVTLFSDSKDDSVYFATGNGIYRHILGGSAMEQVVNGALNSLADPTFHVQDMIRSADGSFKGLCWKESGGGTSLFSYAYDPDMSAVPEKELKAYALYDNTELRQTIAMYQKAHPDVYIDLELALSGDGAMTLSDALRALNTNILAGKGPDVIFLDGMPVENYLEKGLLADLSDVAAEAAKDGGLFDNIVGAYRKDGKDYAIPMRFGIPILDAESGVLSSVKDLTSAADAIEQLRKENPKQKSITGLVNASFLLDQLYAPSSPAWVKEDGSLDREALSQFFQQAKRIFDTELPEEKVSAEAGGSVSFSTTSSGGGAMNTVELLGGDRLVSYELLASLGSLSSLVSVNDEMEGYQYAPQAGQASNVFIPAGLVGVSAKSAQPEEARSFVKYLLSKEAQLVDQGLGLPVNRAAFDELAQPNSEIGGGMAMIGEDGAATIQLTLRSPTAEEFAALKEMAETLETPALQDTTIRGAVLEAGTSYLEGGTDLEAALDGVLKKVNLYLSE